MIYLVVFFGAGIGGAARHAVNTGAARLFGYGFPFGTLTVNVLGSVIMGLLTEFFVMRSGLPQELRLFMTTGVLGGFTTFSTFSLDAVSLWERGQWGLAILYVALSLGASLVGLFIGLSVIRFGGQGAENGESTDGPDVLRRVSERVQQPWAVFATVVLKTSTVRSPGPTPQTICDVSRSTTMIACGPTPSGRRPRPRRRRTSPQGSRFSRDPETTHPQRPAVR